MALCRWLTIPTSALIERGIKYVCTGTGISREVPVGISREVPVPVDYR
jgi:hypothetical protein